MVLSKTKLLEEYRDKCYVSNILCQLSSEYYSRFKNVFSVPLLLSSSVMTILNSSDINSNDMKIANIVLNGCTVLLIAFMNNFKFVEKQNSFRSIGIKFNKLTHIIEDKLTYDIKDVSHDIINSFIKEYDTLNEILEFSFPENIKNKVRETYKDTKTLPNVLNCVTVFTSPQISIDSKQADFNMNSSIRYPPTLNISPIVKPLKFEPTVLNVKKIYMDIPVETSNICISEGLKE
jgi:hypothetical protein